MPLVPISLREGKSEQTSSTALGDGVHPAMGRGHRRSGAGRFQIITEHPANGLIYDASYVGIERSDDIVIVQITLSAGRKLGQKRKLYRRMSEILGKNPGLRPQDLVINLVEVAWENWSFSNGEGQYAM